MITLKSIFLFLHTYLLSFLPEDHLGALIKNSQHFQFLLVITFLYSIILSVSAQYSLHYPSDTDKNSSLKKFVFCNTSLDVKTWVKDLVNNMTLQEKTGSIVSVAGSIILLGIPSYGCSSEAFHGASYTGPATWFHFVKGLQETEDGDEDWLKITACCKNYTAYDDDYWTSVDRFHFNEKSWVFVFTQHRTQLVVIRVNGDYSKLFLILTETLMFLMKTSLDLKTGHVPMFLCLRLLKSMLPSPVIVRLMGEGEACCRLTWLPKPSGLHWPVEKRKVMK